MKINITEKLLIVLLLLTMVPLSLLGYIAINDIRNIGDSSVEEINSIGESTLKDSTDALNKLGEDIIKQKAIDVAKQMEIYIKENPDMSVEDLQNDDYFKSIAVQPVGETGYTAIVDVETLVCRFHASDKIVNLDLHNLAEKLPGFWSVMSQSQGGAEVDGYYKWAEPDGSMKQKYMAIRTVDAKTFDGVTMSVSATTYIDEFSKPVEEMEKKIDDTIDRVTKNIIIVVDSVKKKALAFILLIGIVTVFSAIIFAHSITRPIKRLTDASNKVAEGDLDVEIPEIKSKDEIQNLSGAIGMLIGAIKFLKKEKESTTKKAKKK